MCAIRHSQVTHNNNLVISLQYLKKDVSDEVDFLHIDKHENLLQIDAIILTQMVKHSQSSQDNKFSMSLQYFKKLEMELIFYMQINIKFSKT